MAAPFFFFPDSQDLVDPSFCFQKEDRAVDRIRHQDDQYPHEIFASPPYDGLLVSMAMVVQGRYSLAQRQRFLRDGVRKFFRLDRRPDTAHLRTIGDCGAFTYREEEVPPYTVDEVINFYTQADFDLGISVDHVILPFYDERDERNGAALLEDQDDWVEPRWRHRQEITLEMAREFLHTTRGSGSRFEPVGVTQGWNLRSYLAAFKQLEAMGYRYIALGGLVPMKTPDIRRLLLAIQEVRSPGTKLHLLGITRTDDLSLFIDCGVASFDSTSPLLQAFKDDKNNFHTLDGTAYMAVRIPQVDANPKLKARILAGQVDGTRARELELQSLRLLEAYEREDPGADLDTVLAKIEEYEVLHEGSTERGRASRADRYRETLGQRPWKSCPCAVCRQLGVQVVIYRGAERNRRRGFHNLWVFHERLRRRFPRAVLREGLDPIHSVSTNPGLLSPVSL